MGIFVTSDLWLLMALHNVQHHPRKIQAELRRPWP